MLCFQLWLCAHGLFFAEYHATAKVAQEGTAMFTDCTDSQLWLLVRWWDSIACTCIQIT